MFKSAVRKLTFWYIGALVFVCIVFSALIYEVASVRLERGAMRQADILQNFQGMPIDNIGTRLRGMRDQQLENDRRSLRLTLLLTNAGVLLIGSYFSYLFAKRTLKPIEESHALQARFAQDASHELRTPLSVMMAEIEVALANKKLSIGDAKAVLNSNLEEIQHLQNLSEQLLNLTRLDTARIENKNFNLSQAITKEIAKLNNLHGIKVNTKISPDIFINGNRQLLTQVLTILVSNAVNYSGKNPIIGVDLSRQNHKAHLRVTDNGSGISPAHQKYVFDRFYSVHKLDGKKGHGLGLAIAKEIVELHNGKIALKSEPAQGTIFIITLPLVGPTT